MKSSRTWLLGASALLTSLLPTQGHADSVAQIATAVRISRATAAQIDPQGRPAVVTEGSNTAVQVGDVLTFVAAFTPVPNNGYRGLGGYVTVYIPRNTEVVGARIIDGSGRTIAPRRGGLAAEGIGPQGDKNIVGTNDGGSMSQLYADTGIFYSTDPLTNRVPDGSAVGEDYLLVSNGVYISPLTTAFTQLNDILGAKDLFAHNRWDAIQAHAFGTKSSPYSNAGRGNTLHRYGSPVAGPDSFYLYDATYASATFSPFTYASLEAKAHVGPWKRIRTLGAEIGRVVTHLPPSALQDDGTAMRVGVAAETAGVPNGIALSGVSPLPSYDAGAPSTPYTRALRFAVGELIVGQEYFSEFSLRVLDTPLDPVANADVVCAEVFGGDASSEGTTGTTTKDGKDNAWRYFLPAPACVSLDLLFDLDVSQLVALPQEVLEYTITGKNLTTSPQTNVVVRYCFSTAEETFLTAGSTPGFTQQTSTACPDLSAQSSVFYTIPKLEPGQEFSYKLRFTAIEGGDGDSIVGRALYSSTQLPSPGFQTSAFTVIHDLAVLDYALEASPATVPSAAANGTVTYTASVSNSGKGVAECGANCEVRVTLPEGFTYVNGSLRVNGAAVAGNGVQTGREVVFKQNLTSIDVGGTFRLQFNVSVPAGTAPGRYTSALEMWLSNVGGQRVNDALAGLAPVVVNTTASSAPPPPTDPLGGDTKVCGSAGANATVRVYVAGIEVASGVANGSGTYCVTVAALTPGQAVSVTAQEPNKLESAPSQEVTVAGFTGGGGAACSDGKDNDGDGKVDFPEDDGCTGLSDVDEAPLPECADGDDNDGDGKVDLADEGCSDLLDSAEGGPAACDDGLDNDGDGLSDLDDPGCSAASDASELDAPACSDGIDNDGDDLVDYPFDDGCNSAQDDDETLAAGGPMSGDGGAGGSGGSNGSGGNGGSGAGSSGGDSGGGDSGGASRGSASGDGIDAGVDGRPDLGGVDAPKVRSGCSVTQGGNTSDASLAWLLVAGLGLARLRARRRT